MSVAEPETHERFQGVFVDINKEILSLFGTLQQKDAPPMERGLKFTSGPQVLEINRKAKCNSPDPKWEVDSDETIYRFMA